MWSGSPIGVVGFIKSVMHVSDTANASAPVAKAILAGDIPPETATERVAAIEHREALWVPLLRETRLAATAGGVRAAGTQPGQWPGGLSSAGAWTLADTVGRRTKIQEVP